MTDERSLGIIKDSLRFASNAIDNAEIALATTEWGAAHDIIGDAEQALASAKRICAVLRDEDMAADHG